MREILIERQLANMTAVARGSAFARRRYMRYIPRLPQLEARYSFCRQIAVPQTVCNRHLQQHDRSDNNKIIH